MESQLSNALLDVKLPYEFMKKEYFEFCEYYRKKWQKIRKFVIFLKFQKFEFLTNGTLFKKTEIQSAIISQLSIVKIHAIRHQNRENPNFSSKNFAGSKSGTMIF